MVVATVSRRSNAASNPRSLVSSVNTVFLERTRAEVQLRQAENCSSPLAHRQDVCRGVILEKSKSLHSKGQFSLTRQRPAQKHPELMFLFQYVTRALVSEESSV